MDESYSPQQLLALRLRNLREQRWPGIKVTQAQLAQALGGDKPLSVPLISSWESVANPTTPPLPRLESYATFFATPRSVADDRARLLRRPELTGPELAEEEQLRTELLSLRAGAIRPAEPPVAAVTNAVIESLSSGLWRFADGGTATLVCAQLPAHMLAKIPYSDPADPDYVSLYAYADLDAFVELHGHVRAANPGNEVYFRTAAQLASDDYSTHLVSLGGVDWNYATSSLLEKLALPVRQVADWSSAEGPYFEVLDGTGPTRFHPVLSQLGDRKSLREDVAMFARSVNPFNRDRTATICNGMYASGTFGAVRSLTDARFRDRNSEYAKARFGRSETFCILTKVQVERGVPVTPDWTLPENRLFEWASES